MTAIRVIQRPANGRISILLPEELHERDCEVIILPYESAPPVDNVIQDITAFAGKWRTRRDALEFQHSIREEWE